MDSNQPQTTSLFDSIHKKYYLSQTHPSFYKDVPTGSLNQIMNNPDILNACKELGDTDPNDTELYSQRRVALFASLRDEMSKRTAVHPLLPDWYRVYSSSVLTVNSLKELSSREALDQEITTKAHRRRRLEAVFASSKALKSSHRSVYHANSERLEKLIPSIEKTRNRINETHLENLKATNLEGFRKALEKKKEERLRELNSSILTYIRNLTIQLDPSRKEVQTDDQVIEEYNKIVIRREEEVSAPAGLHGELRDHQMEGLKWAVALYNGGFSGILADDMGLGKTCQVIALFLYLVEKKRDNGPFLVISPTSTAENWRKELERFAPSLKVLLVKTSKEDTSRMNKRIEKDPYDVLLTTFELFNEKAKYRSIKSRVWRYIVIDEAHRIKNNKTKINNIVNTELRSSYRLALTGTPLQNDLSELWSLLNFILPHVFSSNTDFELFFKNTIGDEADSHLNQLDEQLLITRLHDVLRPFLLRRTKHDVLHELPEKHEFTIWCPLSGWQKAIYDCVAENRFLPRLPESCTSPNNMEMALRQVVNSPLQVMSRDEYKELYGIDGSSEALARFDEELWRYSGKLWILKNMLIKLIRHGHRILIFSQYKTMLDLLKELIESMQISFCRIDGNTCSDERGTQITNFNDPNSEQTVFLLSTKAGGLGINLQTADTVVIFDSDWNPANDQQAADRAYRIGQKNSVKVIRMLTNTAIEQKMLDITRNKKTMNDKVIQDGSFQDRVLDPKARKELMEALFNQQDQAEEEEAAPKKEGFDRFTPMPLTELTELNKLLARSEEERIDFDRMDIEEPLAPLIAEPPEWVQATIDMEITRRINEACNLNYGRGMRTRSTIVSEANSTAHSTEASEVATAMEAEKSEREYSWDRFAKKRYHFFRDTESANTIVAYSSAPTAGSKSTKRVSPYQAWMYWKLSFVYNGLMESPLSKPFFVPPAGLPNFLDAYPELSCLVEIGKKLQRRAYGATLTNFVNDVSRIPASFQGFFSNESNIPEGAEETIIELFRTIPQTAEPFRELFEQLMNKVFGADEWAGGKNRKTCPLVQLEPEEAKAFWISEEYSFVDTENVNLEQLLESEDLAEIDKKRRENESREKAKQKRMKQAKIKARAKAKEEADLEKDEENASEIVPPVPPPPANPIEITETGIVENTNETEPRDEISVRFNLPPETKSESQ